MVNADLPVPPLGWKWYLRDAIVPGNHFYLVLDPPWRNPNKEPSYRNRFAIPATMVNQESLAAAAQEILQTREAWLAEQAAVRRLRRG